MHQNFHATNDFTGIVLHQSIITHNAWLTFSSIHNQGLCTLCIGYFCMGWKTPGKYPSYTHASISGVVLAIEKRPIPHPSGIDGMCIVIDSDGALVGQLA
jgi:hypothetical protein